MSAKPQLRSDDPAILEIEKAFALAEYDALDMLLVAAQPRTPSQHIRVELVRARLARIRGDVSIWHASASNAAALGGTEEQRLTALALKATASVSGGRAYGNGARELASLALSVANADPVAAGPATYLIALDAWQNRDYDLAERTIARNIAAGAYLPNSRTLCGWIDVRRERFAQAGIHFEAALAALASSRIVDERVKAKLVHAVANVAAETIDLAMGDRALATYATIRWTVSLAIERAWSARALHDLALLKGDLEEAWDFARQSATYAPPGPYVAIGELISAALSKLVGDRFAEKAHMQRAWQILRDTHWRDGDREERIALTDFAVIAAQAMPTQARQTLTIYRSISAATNTLSALDHDRRVVASETTASASMSATFGKRADAIREYERALDVWQSLGHSLRVAQVATELWDLTRDQRYVEIVEAALRNAPKAWLRSRIRREASPLDALTSAERRILRELLVGKSAKTIAISLGRSPHTVSNHTRKIFAAFAVTSRGRLLARCAELGITPASFSDSTPLRRGRAAASAG